MHNLHLSAYIKQCKWLLGCPSGFKSSTCFKISITQDNWPLRTYFMHPPLIYGLDLRPATWTECMSVGKVLYIMSSPRRNTYQMRTEIFLYTNKVMHWCFWNNNVVHKSWTTTKDWQKLTVLLGSHEILNVLQVDCMSIIHHVALCENARIFGKIIVILY